MSWLYSIIFAGLMISSPELAPAPISEVQQVETGLAEEKLDVTEKFEQTYPLSPDGSVSVSNINGPIVIEASDRNEVRLEATKIADSAETLAEVDIEVESQPNSLRAEAKYKSWRYNDQSDRRRSRRIVVHFKLIVPRTAELRAIESVNGTVTVSNFTRSTTVSVVNGDVVATNLSGSAKLSTVNGQVNAGFESVQQGTAVSLNTVNGRVNLTLPSDVNATLRAESLNGEITNEFGLPVKKGKYIGRSLHGRIGSGETRITLDSVNGGLSIARKKDGKAPNHVENLLSATADDESVNVGRTRARAASSRAATAAMADAQRRKEAALRQAQEELSRMNVDEQLAAGLSPEILEKAIAHGLEASSIALNRLTRVNWTGGLPTLKKTSRTFPVSKVPTLSVEASECIVTVRSWDKPEVSYTMTEMVNPTGESGSVTEDVSENTIWFRVRGEMPPMIGAFSQGGTPRIEIYVPRKADISIRSDSAVNITGVNGDINVVSEDNLVTIRDTNGQLNLNMSDGSARVLGVSGALQLTARESESHIEGSFESFKADVDRGSLTLTLPAALNARLVSNVPLSVQRTDARPDGARILQFGTGGPEYNFTINESDVVIRDINALESY